ncbi:GRASP_SAV_5884, ATP-grasp ribosomal peptide maturase, SAV_5884 family [Methylophilaceae bacterium]
MLLVLTASFDGTSDLLFEHINKKAFRFNFDIFEEYEVELTPSYWRIRNPVGLEITSETASKCFWWKVTNYQAHEDGFVNEEVKYVFREIYNWFLHRNLVKGTPPDFHNRNGKIHILSVAKNHFPIPETYTGWGFHQAPNLKNRNVVAKSLSSGLTTTNHALFTTAVDINKLNPKFPWYLQETVEAEYDTTIFICDGKPYAFQRSREDLKGLDWRSEQDFNDTKQWNPRDLSATENVSINNFCAALNIDWGRIDFLERNGDLIFLEYNANGQWVFLDYENKMGLVEKVCNYLCET